MPPFPPAGPEGPRRRWGWRRIILGALLVLLCSAGGSAVFALEQVHTLRDALNQNGSLKLAPGVLASAGWGDPQTLLLVGDDTRPLTRYYHRAVPHLANEMLLVRLDPSKPYISLMSIPRELRVTVYRPNGLRYTDRLNSAYTYGIRTLVSTIKRVLGLPVNHVIVMTFPRFKRAVDDMGCVYSTVDRRYFHANVPGGEQYQEINLQPGYQKLCGQPALEFVSYRHNDTSLVRDARDQSFLLDVKKQYGPTLSDNVDKFERIFGHAVQTDPALHSTAGILNLIGTLISSSSRRVRRVHFQANLLSSYDTATPQQISASVNAFLYGSFAIPKQKTAAVAHIVHGHNAQAKLPLVPVPPSSLAAARAEALNLPFPLEYPRVEDRGGSATPPSLRGYLIHAPDGSAYPAYAAVFSGGGLGQYYDVQGMTWTTAPQFDSPDQTVRVGGRNYYLFYEASNLRMVAWYEHGAVYWVRNSLTDSVSNGELLAIAEQARAFTAVHASSRTPVVLKAAGVPLRASAQKPLKPKETIGALAGLLTLLAFPLLAFFGIRRIRDLRRARNDVATGRQVSDGLAARGGLAPLPTFGNGGVAGYQPAVAPAGVAAGAGLRSTAAGPGVPLQTRWSEERRVYRGSRSRRTAAIVPLLLLLLVIAGGGAAAFLLLRHSGGAAGTKPAPAKHVQHGTAPPLSVPVVVLNASPATGAAHTLSLSLQAEHVSVSAVGDVTETRPPGTEVLYANGERSQAERLAGLLRAKAPTVAPIDPVTAAAAAGAKLVVLIG